MKPSDLPTHKPKPCSRCKGLGKMVHIENPTSVQKQLMTCLRCLGHKVEPVEVENPCLYEAPENIKDKGLRELWVLNKIAQAISEGKPTHQLQLGKVFEVELEQISGTVEEMERYKEPPLKFLPIREVKKGDLSKVWVVKCG